MSEMPLSEGSHFNCIRHEPLSQSLDKQLEGAINVCPLKTFDALPAIRKPILCACPTLDRVSFAWQNAFL
jgi:hypothetical protein